MAAGIAKTRDPREVSPFVELEEDTVCYGEDGSEVGPALKRFPAHCAERPQEEIVGDCQQQNGSPEALSAEAVH